MPGIYQGTYSVCGTDTEETGSGYIAVWVDKPAGMWAHPDEPHLAILGHPLEESILEDVGYTFSQAGSERSPGGRHASLVLRLRRAV